MILRSGLGGRLRRSASGRKCRGCRRTCQDLGVAQVDAEAGAGYQDYGARVDEGEVVRARAVAYAMCGDRSAGPARKPFRTVSPVWSAVTRMRLKVMAAIAASITDVPIHGSRESGDDQGKDQVDKVQHQHASGGHGRGPEALARRDPGPTPAASDGRVDTESTCNDRLFPHSVILQERFELSEA